MNKVLKAWRREGVEAGVILLILYLACWPVSIRGISMEYTLQNRDRVFISRLLVEMSAYAPGDLVVFNWEAQGKRLQVVKRVIAMEGDQVEIQGGNVIVNGQTLLENYARGHTEGVLSLEVPDDCVFVLGDNREHSEDSRFMGPIPKEKLVGKVLFRWYPFNHITGF